MTNLKQKNLYVFLFGLFLMFFMVKCGSEKGLQGMVSKKYPEGFSLKHPKSWVVRIEEEKHIVISAPSPEQDPSFVLVYPFFLEKRSDLFPTKQPPVSVLNAVPLLAAALPCAPSMTEAGSSMHWDQQPRILIG